MKALLRLGTFKYAYYMDETRHESRMNRITTNCPNCVESGERGSCARYRCYCGHRECWAFDSYFKPETVAAPVVRAADKRMAQSWAEREEPTWLDR